MSQIHPNVHSFMFRHYSYVLSCFQVNIDLNNSQIQLEDNGSSGSEQEQIPYAGSEDSVGGQFSEIGKHYCKGQNNKKLYHK